MIEGKGGTILIVEDDRAVSRLEQQQLERAGYTVVCAATADEAVLALREHDVDLILLDYTLPGDVTGLRLYGRIRQAGHAVPVIIVTDVTNEATLISALR